MGLFKPGWMSEDREKALKAVEKLTDQEKLMEAARTAPDSEVRRRAVERMTDQALLLDIVKTCDESALRWTAAEGVTDQAALMESFKAERGRPEESNTYKIKETLVDKLYDQDLVFDFAMTEEGEDPYFDNRIIGKITDQKKLQEIAQHAANPWMQRVAAGRLTDTDLSQAAFTRIATDKSAKLNDRIDAIRMIAGSEILADLAKNDRSGEIRAAAVSRLVDREALADIATSDKSWDVRWTAAKKLDDKEVIDGLIKEKCGKGYHEWERTDEYDLQHSDDDLFKRDQYYIYTCARCGETKTEYSHSFRESAHSIRDYSD